MVAMAAVQIGTGSHGTSAGQSRGSAQAPFLLTTAVDYAGLSVAVIQRMPARLDGAQIGAMAASVALMAVATV